MPVYSYKCVSCKFEFDMFRTLQNANRPTLCPECGGETQKQVSSPVLQENLGTKLRAKLGKKKPPKEYR
jgi:putative FmdB family regulatory protein